MDSVIDRWTDYQTVGKINRQSNILKDRWTDRDSRNKQLEVNTGH